MLISIIVVFLMEGHVDTKTSAGAILEGIGIFIIGINLPAVIPLSICSAILRKYCIEPLNLVGVIPYWIWPPFEGTLFWLAWHFLLRFMRKRTLEKALMPLSLKTLHHDSKHVA